MGRAGGRKGQRGSGKPGEKKQTVLLRFPFCLYTACLKKST